MNRKSWQMMLPRKLRCPTCLKLAWFRDSCYASIVFR